MKEPRPWDLGPSRLSLLLHQMGLLTFSLTTLLYGLGNLIRNGHKETLNGSGDRGGGVVCFYGLEKCLL